MTNNNENENKRYGDENPVTNQLQVYVVTSGIGEEYHIDAIFSDAELAKQYIELHEMLPFAEEYNIDVRQLDPPICDTSSLNIEFDYNTTTRELMHTATRVNGPGTGGYFLVLNGVKRFRLSPNGVAVREYRKCGDTKVICALAESKTLEFMANDGLLEEI